MAIIQQAATFFAFGIVGAFVFSVGMVIYQMISHKLATQK